MVIQLLPTFYILVVGISHHSDLNKYKMTQSENYIVFLGYGSNGYHCEYAKLTLTVNEMWKLLLNRMNIISSCISFSANTGSTSYLSVLYFYSTHCMFVISAL